MSFHTQQIVQAIKSSNAFIGSKEVSNVVEIATTPFSSKTHEEMKSILRNGEYERLKFFERPKDLLGEELSVVQFSDENGKIMYALYYDSIALWQVPEVLGIYPEVKPASFGK